MSTNGCWVIFHRFSSCNLEGLTQHCRLFFLCSVSLLAPSDRWRITSSGIRADEARCCSSPWRLLLTQSDKMRPRRRSHCESRRYRTSCPRVCSDLRGLWVILSGQWEARRGMTSWQDERHSRWSLWGNKDLQDGFAACVLLQDWFW